MATNLITEEFPNNLLIEPISTDLSINSFSLPEDFLPQVPPDIILAFNKNKKKELVAAHCTEDIYKGVDIETTLGTEHFSLTITDQNNISKLVIFSQQGHSVLYHADGQLCRSFSPEEFLNLAAAATSFITYKTTLANHFNRWIKRCETLEELDSIEWGVTLPEDLQQSLDELLATLD
jgi:hypothetical protein